MTLFDIIGHGDRVLLLADDDTKSIYTWNRSVTLQCWHIKGIWNFEEVDIQTLSNVPEDIDEAIGKVRVWHAERMNK